MSSTVQKSLASVLEHSVPGAEFSRVSVNHAHGFGLFSVINCFGNSAALLGLVLVSWNLDTLVILQYNM